MTDVAIHSWIQLGTFLVATFVFMWYMRKDSKDDYVRLDIKLEAWRKESKEDNRRIESLINAIQQEIKDFHGRLCALEEKNRDKGK